jgi:uncharacterized protein YciI
MYFLLTYHTVDDYVNRRQPYREDHLAHARDYFDRGLLILGGALADPADKAIVVFKSDTKRAVEEFVENDPYVQEGLIRSWEIREWTVVVGG